MKARHNQVQPGKNTYLPENTAEITSTTILRKLASGFHSLFLQSQQQGTRYLELSVSYRQVMDLVFEDVEAEEKTKQTVVDDSALLLLRETSMIWHLFEIFSLLPADDLVAPHLFEWQHNHISIVDDKMLEELKALQEMKSPESTDSYWDLLNKFALTGLNRYICDLLSWHSGWKGLKVPKPGQNTHTSRFLHRGRVENELERLLYDLVILLSTTPSYAGNVETYQIDLKSWKSSLSRLINLTDDDRLRTLIGILSGDANIISDEIQNWSFIEQICAISLHCEPLLEVGEFGAFAEDFERRKGLELDDTTSKTLSQILQGDFREAIHGVIATSREKWWFAAHLTDLLENAGVIEPVELHDGEDRERAICNYVEQLVEDRAFLPLAASYLQFCPNNGREILHEIIATTSLNTEKELRGALKLCAQYGVEERVKSTLYDKLATKYLQQDMYCAALRLFIESGDVIQCRKTSTALVHSLVVPLEKSDPELMRVTLNSLVIPLDISQGCIFLESLADSSDLFTRNWKLLRCYYHLSLNYKEGNWGAIQRVVTEILTKNLVPRELAFSLLCDCAAIIRLRIEEREVVFDTATTHLLMKCLNDVTSSPHEEHRKPLALLAPKYDHEQALQHLKWSFSKNLSKAILSSGTGPTAGFSFMN
eukprot:TRINITY_DN5135_c0_g1_i1.p1 TRINITY_DN5135_c0_g1~~TRINITY_DN5135_c0_g1_i1.p1  ORF type:complete len:653 (+),score=111.96 TRINITY_DN5135_c0_g1_i1:1878-3836(+)